MQSNFELKLSFVVVLFLAIVYIGYEIVTIPKGGHPFGHALGVLGAVLMLMAETLYSARKRLRWFTAGQLRHWLSFHIFTGIVGPALVLMHTGIEFRGLAGFTTLMMAFVVGSGFLGRYIYTAVPRTLAGVEVDRLTLEVELVQQQKVLQNWVIGKPKRIQALMSQELAAATISGNLTTGDILVRRVQEWREQYRIKAAIRKIEKEERTQLADFERLLRRQSRYVRYIRSLQTIRRLMGFWHMAHVPLGLTLFTAMTVHIVGTIYFGALS